MRPPGRPSAGPPSCGSQGITTIWPGTYDEKRHRCELEVGRTRLTNRQVLSMLSDMSDEWSGQKYRLVGYNCQTFAIAFCKALSLHALCSTGGQLQG